MDKLVELLNNGIALKRAGQYEKALACYSDAIAIDPNDNRAYGNIAKLMIGLRRYDIALRHYMVVCVFRSQALDFNTSPCKEIIRKLCSELAKRKDVEFNGYRLTANYFVKQIAAKSHMSQLVYYGGDSSAYYIGHAVIAQHPDVIQRYSIPQGGMRGLESNVLGAPSGYDIRDGEYDDIFYFSAFAFVDRNYNSEVDTVASAARYYLSEKIRLNYDFSQCV